MLSWPTRSDPLQGILEDIKDTQATKSLGYADIFTMFMNAEQSGQPITAADVNAKQQEKLLMLGPVLEEMNFDLFNPLHEWLVAEGFRHGKYPPPPPAIGKATIRVRYVSVRTGHQCRHGRCHYEVYGLCGAGRADGAGDAAISGGR